MLLIARIAQSIVEGVFAMSQTVCLTKATFLVYILPPFACQYLMGVLVQLEGTRTYRIALLPVAVSLAWRATFVDMSGGDPTKAPMDFTLIVSSTCSVLHQLTRTASDSNVYRRDAFRRVGTCMCAISAPHTHGQTRL